MKSDEFIECVAPILKKQSFRKTQATWRKDLGESIAVFNVQKSQWDGNDFYVNVGLYYHAIGDESSPSENRCHIRNRLEVDTPDILAENAMAWFRSAATLKDAQKLAGESSENYLAVKKLRDAKVT